MGPSVVDRANVLDIEPLRIIPVLLAPWLRLLNRFDPQEWVQPFLYPPPGGILSTTGCGLFGNVPPED